MIGGTAAALASSADLLLHSKERNVAMLVVLLDDPTGEFSLSQDLVTSLAQLGVTNAALVRDEQTAGIVLEGSLFDPARRRRQPPQPSARSRPFGCSTRVA